jgi:hypothetical protein
MQEAKRFEIRCPVTVELSDRANDKIKVPGVLCDIGVGGARMVLERPVQPGTKLTLFVHFRAPEKKVTTMRFDGIVLSLQEEPRIEIAVRFRGTGRFAQNQLSDFCKTKAASADSAS